MGKSSAIVAVARSLADSDDVYEMDSCPFRFEDCPHSACAHNILIGAAEQLARENWSAQQVAPADLARYKRLMKAGA